MFVRPWHKTFHDYEHVNAKLLYHPFQGSSDYLYTRYALGCCTHCRIFPCNLHTNSVERNLAWRETTTLSLWALYKVKKFINLDVKLQQYCRPLGLLYTKFPVFLNSMKLCRSDNVAACRIYPLSQCCATHRSLCHTLRITHATHMSIWLLWR